MKKFIELGADGITREAWLSDCERYRHLLRQTWDRTKAELAFMLLNPSTASHLIDDATARVGRGRSQRLGYGSFVFVNVYDWRETDSKRLALAAAPSSADNQSIVMDVVSRADLLVLAWGAHSMVDTRHWLGLFDLLGYSDKLRHIGLTADGAPRHPLRISYDVPLQRFA